VLPHLATMMSTQSTQTLTPNLQRTYHETATDWVADGRCDIASPAWMS
jgi:hypothetical protein